MACCGRVRDLRRAPMSALPMSAVRAEAAMLFEYGGARPIVVVGPHTGATYRFAGRGARTSVHRADAASVAAIPGVLPVR